MKRHTRLWIKYVVSLRISPPNITMRYLQWNLRSKEPAYRYAMIPLGLMRLEAQAKRTVAEAKRGGFDRGGYVRALKELERLRKKRLDKYAEMLKEFRRMLREKPSMEVLGRHVHSGFLEEDAVLIGKHLARVRKSVDSGSKELRSEIMKRQGIRKLLATAGSREFRSGIMKERGIRKRIAAARSKLF